jgi:hypothetical protein
MGRDQLKNKINSLKNLEEKAIVYTMAMESYNPSIGRVLRKGGVDDFVKIAWRMVQELPDINEREEFDEFHDKYVREVQSRIQKTARSKPVSYGQAQKAINVFLKNYIDWGNLPNKTVADRLRPYLHVPLDSRVMRSVKEDFPKHFKKYRLRVVGLWELEKEDYYQWQQCFRDLAPDKPLLIDVYWAKERFGLG